MLVSSFPLLYYSRLCRPGSRPQQHPPVIPDGEGREEMVEMLEMLEMARQIRWPQIIKFLPVGAGPRLHRAAPCSVHHPILAGQISQQRRSWHTHTRGNATVGPLPSNRFYKTWEKVQLTSIHSFLQNEIGFIQSQLFSLIIWWSLALSNSFEGANWRVSAQIDFLFLRIIWGTKEI